MATLNDKRRQKRIAMRCSIEFKAEGQINRGFSKNLSLYGLFIMTRNPVSPDTIIEMVVDLPNESIAKLRGRVTRAFRDPSSETLERAGIPSNNGMGIEITEKDSNYVKFISSSPSGPESQEKQGRLHS